MKSLEENASERCPQCGAIMTEALPQNLCPACMMRRAFTPSVSEAAEAADHLALTQTLDENVPPKNPGSSDSSLASSQRADGELIDGQRFGDYTIVRRLGRGGMGTVYEADHTPTGRRVALKVLTHSLDNPEARARFLREGRLAASINHPNSVYVYGTEEIGDTPTISMELIRGGTLQQWVRAKGKMEVAAAVDAVLQIIEGLEAADRKGVLHRDVKPANCFIDQSGTIKIGDFGLSISTEARDDLTISNVTCEGVFLGTPAFASPEQLRGEPLDRRSDIYSVGVTLFYLLTGQTPFSGENMVQLLATVLDKPAPSLRSIRSDVPEELNLLIQRCLLKSPGQRFPSYDALREVLLPLSSTNPTPAPLGNRLIAHVIDVVALSIVVTFVAFLGQWFAYGRLVFMGPHHGWYNVAIMLAAVSVRFLYYSLCEWRVGRTLGKHLLRLRVVGRAQGITFRQACTRTAIFAVIPNIPSVIFGVMTRGMTLAMMQQNLANWIGMSVGILYYLLKFGLFVTIRNRNGYAGIHELASGTRVVCKPSLKPRPGESAIPESFDLDRHDGRIGPYHVLQPLWGNQTDGLVLAYDGKLLRRVWVRVQPPGSREVDTTWRNLARSARLRWLGAKRTDAECWDCYEAPTGKPFTQAIDDGLAWEPLVGGLRQLSHELQISVSEASLPNEISLAHLWLTEDESLKILPFAPPNDRNTDSSADADGNTSDADESAAETDHARAAALRLLHQAARYSYDATDLSLGTDANRGTSLSAHQSLGEICHAQALDEASRQLDLLAIEPRVNVPYRIAGMLAVSLALPTLLIISLLTVSLALEQQKSRMPKVTDLSKVTKLLELEDRSSGPGKQQRMDALKTWIAANYRDVLEDDTQMDSFYAIMVIPPQRREGLQELIAAPSPSAEETAAAKRVYEKMISEKGTTVTADMRFFSPRGIAAVGLAAWMETIWIPSLVTAVACRGGVLLWMFGITLVNRRGQRASRLRVLIRMLIGGVPALGIFFAFLPRSFRGGSSDYLTAVMIIFIICLVAVTIMGRGRLLHDRIAGTYLVAR